MPYEYANPNALVSTGWVAEHLHDPAVRLIEVDVDTTTYETGHIPGAVAFNWTTQLADPIRRDIPDKETWEQLLSGAGVDQDTRIVYYGDNNNWFAAFAYWITRMYGHQNVALMNGGRKKWEHEGRPLTTMPTDVTQTSYRARDLDPTYRAYLQDVRNHVAQSDWRALVDVRSPAEFSGEIIAPPGLSETAQRRGHVPGAVNIPWAQAAREDGTFKSMDELWALYRGQGISPDKEIITYCRIGERSSHTWFVLKELLGYAFVRNYDGSWTEYGSLVNVPVELS